MTLQECIDYLGTIEPQPVDMITLEASTWADFKASALAILNEPGVDSKYKAALEAANIKIDEANAIVDGVLEE